MESREKINQRIRVALQEQLITAILGNERVARQYGLLVTDLQTLHLLVMRPDIRSPHQISRITTMPTSTVTKLLDRLENAGYVRRKPDPADRRRTQIELIDEAIEPLHNFYGKNTDRFKEFNKEFSADDLKIVATYLEMITESHLLDFTLPKDDKFEK